MGPSVIATFGGDTKDLANKAGESVSIIKKFTDNVKDGAREAGAALGEIGLGLIKGLFVADVASKALSFFDSILEKAKHLRIVSQEFGVSADAIQLFDKAALKAGGTVEQAQKIWERAKDSLSNLAAGEESAQESFERLHLSARDFIGLNLEQALEKIVRAYQANKDEAGAYAAVLDILGKRSAPQLMAALDKLGTDGFDKLRKDNENLSDSLKTDAVDALNQLVMAIGAFLGRIKNFLGNIAGGFLEVFQLIGGAGAAAFNWITGVKTDWDTVLLMGKKTVANLESQNVELSKAADLKKREKVDLQDVLTAQDEILRQTIETTKGREKLATLGAEYVSLMLTAENISLSEQKRAVALSEAKKIKLEYDKLSIQLTEEETKRQVEQLHALDQINEKVKEAADKLKFESLPATEQLAFLEAQRADIENDRADVAKDTIYYQESQVKINELDLDILKKKLDVEKERIKAVKEYVDAEEDWLDSVMNAPVTGITAGGLNPEFVSGLSTISIQARIRQIQDFMAQKRADYFAQGINPAEADRDASGLAIIVAQLQQELNYRAGFGGAYERGGASGALGYFLGQGGDALSFDRALSGMANWGKGLDQTNQHLSDINGTLNRIFN